ncbi:MAG TPA: hypothetical protein ENF17_04825 [Candidatus Aminicenantes bacterium]|nr:hypothetical protein [Candidatus Aminicenantes bacterium]
MDRHVQLLGILWICMGGLLLLVGFVSFLLFFGISFLPDVEAEGSLVLRLIALFGGGFFLLFALPKLVAGFGLLKRQEWARILTLVLSFFSLLNIPLGTALAIYSFVILTKEESIRLFQRPQKT